jgi:hypothetical protein
VQCHQPCRGPGFPGAYVRALEPRRAEPKGSAFGKAESSPPCLPHRCGPGLLGPARVRPTAERPDLDPSLASPEPCRQPRRTIVLPRTGNAQTFVRERAPVPRGRPFSRRSPTRHRVFRYCRRPNRRRVAPLARSTDALRTARPCHGPGVPGPAHMRAHPNHRPRTRPFPLPHASQVRSRRPPCLSRRCVAVIPSHPAAVTARHRRDAVPWRTQAPLRHFAERLACVRHARTPVDTHTRTHASTCTGSGHSHTRST